MSKYPLAGILAIGLFWAVAGTASPEDLLTGIVGKQRLVDSDHLLTKPYITPSLEANCNISAALQAALTGDAKTFGPALERAEENLREVAIGLPLVAAKRLYRKIVKDPRKTRASPFGWAGL
jgi:hypothetical protein